jgi:SH3-like domain-containing protein
VRLLGGLSVSIVDEYDNWRRRGLDLAEMIIRDYNEAHLWLEAILILSNGDA